MITILAPYGRNEVTAAAIRLAEYGVALGREVHLVASGTEERHVHPAWDGKVRTGRKTGIYKGAIRADHVVHFGYHKEWYDRAVLVGDKATGRTKQILVPNWYGFDSLDRETVKKYDRIVCPSRGCKRAIHSELFHGEKGIVKDRLTWAPWDAGVDRVRTERFVEDEKIKALFVCDTNSIDVCGRMVLELVDELLATTQKVHATLLSVKTWSRSDRKALKALGKKWERRLSVRAVHQFHDVDQEMRLHDWVVLPAVRSQFGLTASRALSCGKPVICNNVEPFNEVVVTDKNGVLVKCDVKYGSLKSPIAVPQYGQWLETLRQALTSPRLLIGLQVKDWGVEDNRTQFETVWRKALG